MHFSIGWWHAGVMGALDRAARRRRIRGNFLPPYPKRRQQQSVINRNKIVLREQVARRS